MRRIRYILPLIVLCVVQFSDAYGAELYGRLQSLYLTELAGETGTLSDWIERLNAYMLPCYVLLALAPACRTLADRYGRKRMLLAALLLTCCGGVVCANANGLLMFLIGNVIVQFATGLDIQNFYFIELTPENRQGMARGVLGAIAAAAAVFIPLMRQFLYNIGNLQFRIFYQGLAVGSVIAAIAVALGIPEHIGAPEHKESKAQEAARPSGEGGEHTGNIKRIRRMLAEQSCGMDSLLVIFGMGLATAGVTFYNEPLLLEMNLSQSDVNLALSVQALCCAGCLLCGGLLTDRLGRRYVLPGMLIVACVSAGVFCMKASNAWISGIAYGGLTGCYWCVYHQLMLALVRRSRVDHRGGTDALLTYVNGAGNAVGIGCSTVWLHWLPLAEGKLLCTVPVLFAVACLLCIRGDRIFRL